MSRFYWCHWCALIRAMTGKCVICVALKKLKVKIHLCANGWNNKDLQVAGLRHTSLSHAVPVRLSDIWHFTTAQQKQLEPLWPSVSHKSNDSVHSWTVRETQRSSGWFALFVCVMCTLKSSNPGVPSLVAGSGCCNMFHLTPPYQSKFLSRY